MSVSNNVIMFPGVSKNRPPQTIEEVIENVNAIREIHIDELADMLTVIFLENMEAAGYDIIGDENNTSFDKEIAFIVQAIRSLLMKHDGREHPFQDLAKHYFVEESEGMLVFQNTKITGINENSLF